MRIKTKKQYANAADEVFKLMNKGKGNLTEEENKKVSEMALAIQAYEKEKYPVTEPKTLYGKNQMKLYEKRLTQLRSAKNNMDNL